MTDGEDDDGDGGGGIVIRWNLDQASSHGMPAEATGVEITVTQMHNIMETAHNDNNNNSNSRSVDNNNILDVGLKTFIIQVRKWFIDLNLFYSGTEYTEKDWVRLKVHYPLQK